MGDTKREHYVPECMLQMFTNEDGYLTVWDKEKKNLFCARPRDICNKHMLYETRWENVIEQLGDYVLKNSIEKEFSKYEAIYSHVVKQLLERVSKGKTELLQTSDRRIINQFMALLYLRHPIIMAETMRYYEGVESEEAVKTLLDQTKDLFELWEWGSPSSLVEHSKKKGIFDFSLKNGPAKSWQRFFEEMHLDFFVTKYSHFVTSSFPMLLHEGQDGAIDAIIPISSYVAMYFSNRNLKSRKCRCYHIGDDLVADINSLYMSMNNSYARFVIGVDEKDLSLAQKRDEKYMTARKLRSQLDYFS